MPFERRSYYEFGDPVHSAIVQDEARDHAWAKRRGEQALAIADAILDRLVSRALVTGAVDVRVEIFSAVADTLYGDVAIDVPTLRPANQADGESR